MGCAEQLFSMLSPGGSGSAQQRAMQLQEEDRTLAALLLCELGWIDWERLGG